MFSFSPQFQNERIKNGSLCSHFKETVESKCSGIRQLFRSDFFFSRKTGNQILEKVRKNFKAIWLERIYNSHYGNGVPAMFIS
jgi:hypothetical protein